MHLDPLKNNHVNFTRVLTSFTDFIAFGFCVEVKNIEYDFALV